MRFTTKNALKDLMKLKSGGRVVIEDNVDLGALCTIDRGVTGDTTIKKGTKIDNQVHIGHDTVVGEKCLIASQTGIAGCVVIEDEVTIWGQVGMTSGITIGKKAVIFGAERCVEIIRRQSNLLWLPSRRSKRKIQRDECAETAYQC